eukprot:3672357-Pyramimonas_sp.AAC.1
MNAAYIRRSQCTSVSLHTNSGHYMTPIDNCDNPEEVDQTCLHNELKKYPAAVNAMDWETDN